MMVAGFDPGLQTTGWGIVDMQNHSLRYVASGKLTIESSLSLEERLKSLKYRIHEIMETHHPNACAIEDMFVGKFPKSAVLLAHARGVILCELGELGLAIGQYSPRVVKRALTKNGNADKEQVQFMVRKLLPKANPSSLDEADALAIAICHAHHISAPSHARMLSS